MADRSNPPCWRSTPPPPSPAPSACVLYHCLCDAPNQAPSSLLPPMGNEHSHGGAGATATGATRTTASVRSVPTAPKPAPLAPVTAVPTPTAPYMRRDAAEDGRAVCVFGGRDANFVACCRARFPYPLIIVFVIGFVDSACSRCSRVRLSGELPSLDACKFISLPLPRGAGVSRPCVSCLCPARCVSCDRVWGRLDSPAAWIGYCLRRCVAAPWVRLVIFVSASVFVGIL